MNLFGFFLTFLAGLATLLGSIPIFIKFKNKEQIICYSLAFAAGVMINVSLLDLLPNSFLFLIKNKNLFESVMLCLLFICIGINISILIDKYLPNNDSSLYRVGLISLIAIVLHNIPEGIATYLTTTKNYNLGINLTIAIALHNIPEGISIAIPFYYSLKSRGRAFIYTLIAGLSEPLGALIACLFLKKFMTDTIMSFIYCIIVGIMLHISFYELIPKALKYNKKDTFLALLIGIIVMLIVHII